MVLVQTGTVAVSPQWYFEDTAHAGEHWRDEQ